MVDLNLCWFFFKEFWNQFWNFFQSSDNFQTYKKEDKVHIYNHIYIEDLVYSQSVRLPYFCFTITESKSTAQMLNTCTYLCCNLLTFVILVTFDLKSIKINIATQKIQYIMCQHIKNNKLCDFSTVTLRLLYLVWVNTFSNVICKQAYFCCFTK